jgi:hypothetical protein
MATRIKKALNRYIENLVVWTVARNATTQIICQSFKNSEAWLRASRRSSLVV